VLTAGRPSPSIGLLRRRYGAGRRQLPDDGRSEPLCDRRGRRLSQRSYNRNHDHGLKHSGFTTNYLFDGVGGTNDRVT